MNKDNKPYEFPAEMPEREQKLDKGVIIDVVENEIKVKNSEKDTYSMWQYKGQNKTDNT